mmetsp:Transcript_36103/g.72414  ORF Transcript_36103/g.72414 Transcript_36103/m.72414 type:complete len:560 (-) Transcript_36103:574-2253(-)
MRHVAADCEADSVFATRVGRGLVNGHEGEHRVVAAAAAVAWAAVDLERVRHGVALLVADLDDVFLREAHSVNVDGHVGPILRALPVLQLKCDIESSLRINIPIDIEEEDTRHGVERGFHLSSVEHDGEHGVSGLGASEARDGDRGHEVVHQQRHVGLEVDCDAVGLVGPMAGVRHLLHLDHRLHDAQRRRPPSPEGVGQLRSHIVVHYAAGDDQLLLAAWRRAHAPRADADGLGVLGAQRVHEHEAEHVGAARQHVLHHVELQELFVIVPRAKPSSATNRRREHCGVVTREIHGARHGGEVAAVVLEHRDSDDAPNREVHVGADGDGERVHVAGVRRRLPDGLDDELRGVDAEGLGVIGFRFEDGAVIAAYVIAVVEGAGVLVHHHGGNRDAGHLDLDERRRLSVHRVANGERKDDVCVLVESSSRGHHQAHVALRPHRGFKHAGVGTLQRHAVDAGPVQARDGDHGGAVQGAARWHGERNIGGQRDGDHVRSARPRRGLSDHLGREHRRKHVEDGAAHHGVRRGVTQFDVGDDVACGHRAVGVDQAEVEHHVLSSGDV